MLKVLLVSAEIFFSVLIVSVILYIPRIIFHIYGFFKQKRLPKAVKKNKYALIVPARNESRVIRELIESVQSQNYPKELLDVYVVVSDLNDPTIDICNEYERVNCSVLPEELLGKGKGVVLDYAMKNILSSTPDEYKAYFIFDADNVLGPDFIDNMNDCVEAGYEVGMGRRLNKSWKAGWVSDCSYLTFSFVNTLNNKLRSACCSYITISGSGIFVSNRLVKLWGGWPFKTITEDYELTKYTMIHDINSYYCESAEVYDEQPTTLKASARQRIRWIKGHTVADHMYNGQIFKQLLTKTPHRVIKVDFMFNLVPVVMAAVGVVLFLIISLIGLIYGLSVHDEAVIWKAFTYFFSTLGGTYLAMVIYTCVGMIADMKVIDFNVRNTLGMMFLNPVFMFTWLPLFVVGYFSKSVSWKPIEHNLSMKETQKTKANKGK